MKKQYDIIGFSKYTISSDCVVSKKNNGRIICGYKKRGQITRYYILFSDSHDRLEISDARLLYCAVKGINPQKIGRSYRFFFDGNGKTIENIIIHEPWECGSLIQSITKAHRIDKKTYYEQVISFSQVVLSDDTEKIYAEFNRYEYQIKQKIRYHISDEVRLNNVYLKLVNDVVIGMKEKNFLPVHPLFYLKKCINSMVKTNRIKNIDEEKKHTHVRLVEYMDGLKKPMEYYDNYNEINL